MIHTTQLNETKTNTDFKVNIQYRETQKFDLWCSYFFDESNKTCHLNATQSALLAYNYDPDTQYHLASVVGSKNMRKYDILSRITTEKLGYSFMTLMEIGIKKAINGKYIDWEKFMVRIGYFEADLKTQFNQYNQFNFDNLRASIIQSRQERGLPNSSEIE